jgi:hypothetical protein
MIIRVLEQDKRVHKGFLLEDGGGILQTCVALCVRSKELLGVLSWVKLAPAQAFGVVSMIQVPYRASSSTSATCGRGA